MNSRVEALLAMLDRGQDSALLRFSLGNELLARHVCDEAVKHLQQAVKLDENYSAAWKLLGRALTEAGDLSGAVDSYRRGISVSESNGDRQAAKEMGVFLKRVEKKIAAGVED